MKTLAILGASGHGRVAADIALQSGWGDVVFFDDSDTNRTRFEHWSFAGNTTELLNSFGHYAGVFVAIGNNKIRSEKLALLRDINAPIISLIHPRSIISPFATLGSGVMVVGGAVLCAFSCIGDGGIINSGSTVGHDCQLEECVHVAPGAHVAGNVHIGRLSWVGIGAAIRQGLVIGSNVMIGVGAAVVSNAEDGQVLIGVPAKPKN
ncbi:acetyltransferase [Marinagarivorans cellulosilyticus]|uniref:PglD N-terminal domain-containing protein n=1 Tax=Marinagarivorans cellulosilyticus TaxID=2721545 RepID=A0AAN2BJI3_9GAMM|nr:acetyltransferase [Marinagarivorans cellulosilyticus]BCD97023.1 hypothetical protein MARGE09_P1223 [Marinagarivorans cellulosilyticus]